MTQGGSRTGLLDRRDIVIGLCCVQLYEILFLYVINFVVIKLTTQLRDHVDFSQFSRITSSIFTRLMKVRRRMWKDLQRISETHKS